MKKRLVVLDFDGTITDAEEEGKPSDRERLLDFLYTNNYPLTGVAFKDGAGKMLCELCANKEIAVYIVTNSHTESVCNKIVTLSAGNYELVSMCERVIGGAKKYLVDGRPDHVAESITLPGLSRPIYLRRSAYFEVLERLRETHSVGWEAVAVIGDIFELDLALPFALGARVGLVINQFTPGYEKDFIAANPARAGFINSLSEVLSFVS